MPTTIHVSVSIRGLITQLSRSRARYSKLVSDDAGNPMTRLAALNQLMDELAKGHEYLPIGEPCIGFSYITGCLGHRHD
jgi:hypothetical protein